jgi:PAS domain S-box-containing protein
MKQSSKNNIKEENSLSSFIPIEKTFINLADSAPFMIWVSDSNGDIPYFNKHWLDFTGRTLDQEKGDGWTECIHPDDLEDCYNTYKKNFNDRKEYTMEYRLKRYDGEYYWILEKGAPLYTEDKNFAGFIGSCFNIDAVKKSETAIRESEELYRNLVDSLAEAVLVIDIHDRVLFANRMLCELTGYSMEEIIGNFSYNLFIDHKDLDKILEKNRLRYLGISDRYEIEILRKDGSKFWANILGSPYKNSNGEITGIIAAISDITKDKLAGKIFKKSELKYRSVVDQVREVIFQTDAEGKINFINPFWSEVTGFTNKETIGQHLLDYVHEEDRKYCVDQFVNIIYQKRPFIRFTTRFNTKNDDFRWVEVNARMSYDENNEIKGTFGTVIDLHERKLAEQELLIAKEKAEESDRLKSNFLAQVSHEIRSPLNIILSYSNFIKDELTEKKENEFEEAFEAINNSGNRLLRTIDLILNMSLLQIGRYDVKIKMVELNPILKNLISEYVSIAQNKNLDLRLNIEDNIPGILADEYTLTQAFQNLIDNSIKYTSKGYVEVSVEKIENKVIVKIRDSGIGISETYLSKLFEPFSQEDGGYTRKFEGAGLGLALTKKYVELNNAELIVNSMKGKGSTFSVILTSA